MKIAIVHDYIKEYGGAERVLEALHEAFPDAPIYTSLYFPEFLGPHRVRFEQMDIRTSWLQHTPFAYKLISPLRLLSPFAFQTMDLSSFDVVVVSQTGAYFPNLVKKGSAKLVSYTHTPPRYLYGYKTARDWKKHKIMAVLGESANHVLRIVDFRASQQVDQFVANSKEVAARIQKFYRKEAIVIYPPVEIANDQFRNANKLPNSSMSKLTGKLKIETGNYYLAGGRLARAKGMDVIVDAFIKNGKPLKIFGKGFAGFEQELVARSKKPGANIEFVGEVTDEEKLGLMSGAKAYVFASFDEDFGITPVEAMSMGTPVIAYKSGGLQETVVDGKTGVFYEPNTPEALIEAVEELEKLKIKPGDCHKRAEEFSKKKFIQNIHSLIKKISE